MTMEEKWKVIKSRLKLTDRELGEMFGYKTAISFANSARRQQVIEGVVRLYERIQGEVQ